MDENVNLCPLCPRGYYKGKLARRFLVARDPDVQEVAHMIVAGVDRKYKLHPCYEAYVEDLGKEKAEELIRGAVEIPGACDVIQDHEVFQKRLGLDSYGLYGGLSEDEKEFIFYEWEPPYPRLRMWVSMTTQDARDIVSGKKKFIHFQPCTEAHFAARKRDKDKLGLKSGLLSRLNTRSQ